MSDTFETQEDFDLRQLDEEYARRRRQAEDRVIRDTNLVEVSEQIATLQAASSQKRKRRDKLNEELKAEHQQLVQLRDIQSAAVERCVAAGIPNSRLVEVTGRHPATLERRLVRAAESDNQQDVFHLATQSSRFKQSDDK